MNEVKLSGGTITITDPVTGEKYTMESAGLRAMVSDIAKDCPELGEVPHELRNAFADGKHTITLEPSDMQINPEVLNALALKEAGVRVSLMEADTARERAALTVEQNAAPRAVSLNRKQRRANDKARRSKVYQKQEAKRRDVAMRAMQAQLAERKRLEEEEKLKDVPFADPRQIGKITRVFAPIEQALHSFVDGEVATMEDGTTLMWANEDGCWYPAVACLRSVIETYARLGHVHGWRNHNAGLTHVANLLEHGKPIHKHDVDAALKTVEWMKFCTLTITPNQFTKEAVEIQIANELRDAGLAPEPTDADLLRDGVQQHV